MTCTEKRIILSGVRPTGLLTIGNLYGAISQFGALAKAPSKLGLFFIANLHALTTISDTKKLISDTISVVQMYLACGLDPERDIIYAQSSIPELCELAWLLNCITPTSDLLSMSQFKEKSKQSKKGDLSNNAGLLTYPVLMAADILGPGAHEVPVGQDQKKHVELARDLARRFNRLFETKLFNVPETQIANASTIFSLSAKDRKEDGSMGKMSKSTPEGAIFLTDREETVKQKFKHACHTGGRDRLKDIGNPQNCNIFEFHRSLSENNVLRSIEQGCLNATIGCGECKLSIANRVYKDLEPIQEKHEKILSMGEDYIMDILAKGGKQARSMIRPRVEEAKSLTKTPTF